MTPRSKSQALVMFDRQKLVVDNLIRSIERAEILLEQAQVDLALHLDAHERMLDSEVGKVVQA